MTLPTYQAKVRRAHITREVIEVALLVGVIFFVVRFGVQSARVPGTAMQPAMQDQQLVIVNKFAYLFGAPQRGDVVLFNYPLNPQQQRFQRVIGIPGDTVIITPSTVSINGHTLKEPYVTSTTGNGTAVTYTLKANQYFLLNDNRAIGSDSRSSADLGVTNGGEGLVGRDYIVGRAAFVFWPANQMHGIDTFSDSFGGLSHTPLDAPLPLAALAFLPGGSLALQSLRERRPRA